MRSNVFVPPPKHIIFFYSVWQKSYEPLKKFVTFIEGIPTAESIDNGTDLICIDDQMQNVSKLESFFTIFSHHLNFSIIFLNQNLFYQGSRTVSLNCTGLILFKNPRNNEVIYFLARQLLPKNKKFLVDAFLDATSKPYSYLFFDFSQNCPENCRYAADILSLPIYYVPTDVPSHSLLCSLP